MILKKEKEDWHYLAVKELFILLREITPKHYGDFCCLKIVFILLEQKTNLNLRKKYLQRKIFVKL